MIRLAVRCSPEQAELVLAELVVLAPNGVEEEHGNGYVEYAIYGGEGELPDLGEVQAAAGDGLVDVVSSEVPDDWADRWRDFHRPILIGDRLRVRPSWEPSGHGAGEASQFDATRTGTAWEGVLDLVVDPGLAFGTGAHPTTRLCLELLLELAQGGEADGSLTDLGTGSGVLAIAAATLGWGPVAGWDHEVAALEAAAANAAANGVTLELGRVNLRERLPEVGRTVAANLTAPVLREVAGLLGRPPAPAVVICSGLLSSELGEVAADFARAGLVEADRRQDGDWSALLLRACGPRPIRP